MPPTLTPEDELCVLLSRGDLSPAIEVRGLQLCAGPLGWEQVLLRAYEHHLIPLLYRSLRRIDFAHVPAGVRTELTRAFRTNALRNEFLRHKLMGILRELSGAGIPAIPLKGVTLSQALYGDPAFRDSADIDLLVPADKVLLARRRIIALGYKGIFAEEFFVQHQFPTGVDCPLNPAEQNPAFPFLVELHWTILHHAAKDPEAIQELWRDAKPHTYFGVSAYALSPEWEFLFLAEHAAGHKWEMLRWLADIHDFCVSVPIDWQQVKEKTERFKLELIVPPTLAACASLFGTPLPSEFAAASLPRGVRLFPNSLAPAEAWKAPLYYPRLLHRPSEKLRWFFETVFVARPADKALLPLPPELSSLYYIWRPLRLSIKWLRLFTGAGFRWVGDRLSRGRNRSSIAAGTLPHGAAKLITSPGSPE